jgi:cytochrome P450
MVDHEEKPLAEDEDELDKASLSSSTGQWKYLKKSLTTKEILAQSILFLFAGSETSASTLSFVSLLLAKNLDVQEKLYGEIKRAFEEHVIILI